jgi:hypothetical protein
MVCIPHLPRYPNFQSPYISLTNSINSRHDLRPETAAKSNNGTDAATRASSDLPPPLNVEGEHNEPAESSEDGTHQRHRISRFLDLSRLRTAPPEERIAALRELREQSRTEEPVEDVEEQQSRRARLTGRLRDTFRIRTRTENPASQRSGLI